MTSIAISYPWKVFKQGLLSIGIMHAITWSCFLPYISMEELSNGSTESNFCITLIAVFLVPGVVLAFNGIDEQTIREYGKWKGMYVNVIVCLAVFAVLGLYEGLPYWLGQRYGFRVMELVYGVPSMILATGLVGALIVNLCIQIKRRLLS